MSESAGIDSFFGASDAEALFRAAAVSTAATPPPSPLTENPISEGGKERRVLAGPMCRRPPAFLRHRPCQRGRLLIRRSDRSSQRCMGARSASTSNRQSSRRLRQGLLQRSRTPHTHDDHQELHHRLQIELLGCPGRAIPHPSPLERAPEQFHLSREERYYLRQQRCTRRNAGATAVPRVRFDQSRSR